MYGYYYVLIYTTPFFLYKKNNRMHLVHLWYAYGMVSKLHSTVVPCHIFDSMECIVGSNMALYINNHYILYYYVDAYQSYIMWHIYSQSPDYLVVKGGSELHSFILLTPYQQG